MTILTQRNAIGYYVSKLRMCGIWLNVMRMQPLRFIKAASLTRKVVASFNSSRPPLGLKLLSLRRGAAFPVAVIGASNARSFLSALFREDTLLQIRRHGAASCAHQPETHGLSLLRCWLPSRQALTRLCALFYGFWRVHVSRPQSQFFDALRRQVQLLAALSLGQISSHFICPYTSSRVVASDETHGVSNNMPIAFTGRRGDRSDTAAPALAVTGIDLGWLWDSSPALDGKADLSCLVPLNPAPRLALHIAILGVVLGCDRGPLPATAFAIHTLILPSER